MADNTRAVEVKILIALFGALICLVSLLMLIFPDQFRNAINKWTSQPRFLFIVIIRVIFGALLLFEAANLKFPLAMKLIGAISILVAIVLLLIGHERVDRFIDWWMKQSENVFRVLSVPELAFGAFLIYVAS